MVPHENPEGNQLTFFGGQEAWYPMKNPEGNQLTLFGGQEPWYPISEPLVSFHCSKYLVIVCFGILVNVNTLLITLIKQANLIVLGVYFVSSLLHTPLIEG